MEELIRDVMSHAAIPDLSDLFVRAERSAQASGWLLAEAHPVPAPASVRPLSGPSVKGAAYHRGRQLSMLDVLG